jgi:hypothetical protein
MNRPPRAAGLALPAAALPAALGLAAAACDRRPPIESCDDDLRGVYEASDGPWMILDQRELLEAYPLFPDAPPAPGLEVAPRAIELRREGAGDRLGGRLRRRYMRGPRVCVARLPVHVTSCAGDALELVLSDPAPPLAWPAEPEQPCTWPRPGPSRVERWRRD